MDLATVLGIVISFGLVLSAIMMGGSLLIFVSVPSLLIVLGGTIGATLVNYPLKRVISVMSVFRRVTQAMIVMFVISIIGFGIKYSFGDPIREMVGINVSAAEREAYRDQLGLNDPVMVQWVRFVKKAVHGDLGRSFFYRKPATEVILKKAPATLELVIASALIVILLSVPIGIYAAVNPRSWLSRLFMGASIVGVSIPVFLTALLLIYVFAVELHWLPSYGRGPTAELFPEPLV